jgi:eukaryotic-like serine/threonine-protein kinase
MALAPGTKLGPYEIVAPLGAGGMGEVYKAHDTHLNRDVALKILPADVAGDPSRRARFELEARAVAALNHPNIVAVYDVGDGYIVSELVGGEPLRPGKLGLRKTIEVAAQIASGLAAAHDVGIVHRDLKPDNILMTRDGRPKILDFGLAKLQTGHAVPDGKTVTVRTEAGLVMGTPGYMSPEQVRGLAADHRSDIFSFGVILHELLSGKRAFQGDTHVETMTAILKQEAPELPETVPAGLRQVVSHCLEKDAVERFQSARDLRFALESLSQSGGHPPVAPGVSPRRRWILPAAVAALACAVGVLLYLREPPHMVWIGSMLGAGEADGSGPRISPDGTTLAYQTHEGPFTQVAVMKAQTGDRMILTHDTATGYVNVFSWAADGLRIYYGRSTASSTPTGVFSVPALGGEERLVLEGADFPEALPDGSLLVVRQNAGRQLQLFRFWPTPESYSRFR